MKQPKKNSLEKNYEMLGELRKTLFPPTTLEEINFKNFKDILEVEELFVQSTFVSSLIEHNVLLQREKIIEGMQKPIFLIYPCQNFSSALPLIRGINDLRIKYLSEYVDKWNMYNDMFGQDTGYEALNAY